MTTTQKKDEQKKDEQPKEGAKSDKKKADASKSAVGRPLAGYATVFANWEIVPVDEGPIDVDPNKLLVIFDVRATAQPIDEFVKQCAGGINTPVKITRMKYLGADGEQAVSPDPKSRVMLKHGAEYYVLSYGRRRTRAAIKLQFPVIRAELKSYKTWVDMVNDAYTENVARSDMTTWDRAVDIKNLKDGGLVQDKIAELRGISSSFVSQYLGVFDMPEPIQKMIGNGHLQVTSVRILRALRDYDTNEVVGLAQRAVDKGWTEDQLKEAVAQFTARKEAAGETPKKKGKKVTRVVDFDKAEVSFVGVKTIKPTMNYFATRVKMLRAKEVEDTPEAQLKHARRLAKEEGILEGLKMASKLSDIPAAALVVESDDEG